MATAIYYFDAHNGITNPSNTWSNPSNAFNGNANSFADSGYTTNPLTGSGTNSPLMGGTVTQVSGRFYGSAGGSSGTVTATFKDENVSLGFSAIAVTFDT